MKTLIVFALALATWLYPYKVASALLTETKIEEIKPVVHGPVLRDTPKQEPAEGLASESHKASKPNAAISNAAKYSGRHYSNEEVVKLIEDYSREYRIDSSTPKCIAKLESGYNQFSKNRSSSASGVFQYLSGTWRATDEGKLGLSVFDASANTLAAVKYMAIHKNARPWVVHSKCPPLKFL